MSSPMFGAKVFFVCGWVFLLAGLFARSTDFPGVDIYLYANYFVVGHFRLALLSSLVCWIYAALYYLGSRRLRLAFHPGLVLVHFFLTFLTLLACNSLGYLGARRSTEMFIPQVVGDLFLISLGLFFAIAILAVVRARSVPA
jgi:heme/copper-type cytochrome/quinol oxidase subunit 1